jgi:hypothetical protein
LDETSKAGKASEAFDFLHWSLLSGVAHDRAPITLQDFKRRQAASFRST